MDGWWRVPGERLAHRYAGERVRSLCGRRHIARVVAAGAEREYRPPPERRCRACAVAPARR